MAVSIHWGTKVITVPRADMTLLQTDPIELRQLDVNWFRLQLKNLEDNAEGMCSLDTHRHNTEVTVGGVTYARLLEIINGYTVTFEDGQYAVTILGGNNNIMDVKNPNQVSVRSQNSGGLILSAGSIFDPDEANGVEAGLTWRQSQRLLTAALAGRLAGAVGGEDPATIIIRNAVANSKARIIAITDQFGNRTEITYDLE